MPDQLFYPPEDTQGGVGVWLVCVLWTWGRYSTMSLTCSVGVSCGGVLQGCVRGVGYQVYNRSSNLAAISQICSLWELDFYEQNF